MNYRDKDEINTEIHEEEQGEAHKMEKNGADIGLSHFRKLDNNLSIREKIELTVKQLNNENYFLAEAVEELQTASY